MEQHITSIKARDHTNSCNELAHVRAAAERLHRQDLHGIEPVVTDPNINVKLYDYIKLRQDHRRVLHRQYKHR
jgi:hypothetical protein